MAWVLGKKFMVTSYSIFLEFSVENITVVLETVSILQYHKIEQDVSFFLGLFSLLFDLVNITEFIRKKHQKIKTCFCFVMSGSFTCSLLNKKNLFY